MLTGNGIVVIKLNLGNGCNICVSNQSLNSSPQKFSYFYNILSALVALSDALIITLSGVVLYYAHPVLPHEEISRYLPVIFLTTIFALMVFYFANLYGNDIKRYYKSSVHKIILLCSLVFLLLIMVIFAFKASEEYSRVWLFSWYLLSTVLVSFERVSYSLYLRNSRREGRLKRNVAIVGGEEQGSRMVKYLESHQEPWMHILAIFDDRVKRLAGASEFPIVGNVEDLIKHVRAHRIDEILVALPWHAESRTLEILKRLQELPVRVRLCPDLVGFNFPNSDYSHYGGIPVMHIYDKPIDGWCYVFKSIEDRLLGLLALLLASPVMLIVALLIKFDSKGPVFFRQKRYGFNNELIEVMKFRSMRVDLQDGDAETLVTRGDPRVTRIGKILRRTSLDELPQILNVLKGEMSMVGPRPHATKAKAAGRYYQDVVSEYAQRHKVKPGITGWAQIHGWRGETDTEEKIIKRVEYDLYYIDHWSLGFDLYILARTVLALFRTENAY